MDLSQNVEKNIWMPPQIWTTIFLTLQKIDFYLVRSCYVAGLYHPLLLIGMLLNSILVLQMKHPFSTSEESITLFLVTAPRELFIKQKGKKMPLLVASSGTVQNSIFYSKITFRFTCFSKQSTIFTALWIWMQKNQSKQ